MKDIHLEPFFNWAFETEKNSECVFARYGALACVARILKQSKREDILPYAPRLLQWILSVNFKDSPDRNILKYGYKVIQRIGMWYNLSIIFFFHFTAIMFDLTLNKTLPLRRLFGIKLLRINESSYH